MNKFNQEQTVYKIREFNRFYMPQLDLLNKSYLASDYSVTEARILFEIVENNECYAHFLVSKLHLDKGYLSRVLKKFEKNKLITKTMSPQDNRFYHIIPTASGKTITRQLIEKSNQHIQELISDFSEQDCKKITHAMETIIHIFTQKLAK